MLNETFATMAVKKGGTLRPLIITLPKEKFYREKTLALMNPSIYNDNGKLILNMRSTNYILYHSEKKLFQHQWGPLVYIHPEHDLRLRTENYFCELNGSDLSINNYQWVDTKLHDKEPLWEFVGLEDARLIRWDGKLYMTGVRRDTTTNGQGRMELCEIDVQKDAVKEITRFRIPPPQNPDSYCEKNWMPFIDLPYHYVKWCNPTEIVKVDPVSGTSETVFLGKYTPFFRDFRGGSQVISFDGGYLALVHEVNLFNNEVGRKDGNYYHRLLYWDKNFNLTKYSDDFTFMGGSIEFAVGMCEFNNDILITFGFLDNASYVLRTNEDLIKSLLTFEVSQ
jgi:hypothetical protein